MLRSTSSLRVWIGEYDIFPVGSMDSPVDHNEKNRDTELWDSRPGALRLSFPMRGRQIMDDKQLGMSGK